VIVKVLRAAAVMLAAGCVLTAVPVDAAQPAAMANAWTRADLEDLVDAISTDHGLDPKLVHSVVRVESNFNPRAVSHKGAMGLMQLMPDTAKRLSVTDPFDPRENVRGGVRELARLLGVYSGSVALALAAYNAGEGAVARYRGIPPYAETRGYVSRIISLYSGRPYSMDPLQIERAPVRMVRDPQSGQALITNVQGSASAVLTQQLSRRAATSGQLRGGFGTSR
jgi:soluble lytic murein transglycosylase-like protein